VRARREEAAKKKEEELKCKFLRGREGGREGKENGRKGGIFFWFLKAITHLHFN